MTSPSLSIILPCAGDGLRLGLDIPKELYEVQSGVPLIQYSLNHIIAAHEINIHIQVLIVTKPGKTQVVDYIRNTLPRQIPIIPIDFDHNYEEWPGSIYSAKAYYTEYNLVLLPDSYLTIPPNQSLLQVMLSALQNHSLVFGTRLCSDPTSLQNLGALYVEDNSTITRFQDKPQKDQHLYNGYWGCFGFRKDIADELHDFLIKSVKKHAVNYNDRSFYPAWSFEVDDYYDLGTWSRIEAFKAEILSS